MPFVVGALIGGGAAIGAAIHSNYSRYRDYHSNYSDAAERNRLTREAKLRELDKSKQRMQDYVNGEIQRLKNEEGILHQGFKKWSVEEAEWQTFFSDYGQYHDDLTKTIKSRIEKQLLKDIADDEQMIRDIDAVIIKINRIQLTTKGAQ